ncbi:gamma-glutamylcyclotransferase [Leptolyngbya sp. 15MV]|nr:gamma-glutamylcyclotransferase [Leptolyngbya sp. 15MV]
MRPIFIYGTLLDARVFARFAGRAPLRRATAAVAHGWRRARLRGTPYPTLVRGPGTVRGALLPPLPAACLQRLAAYEGPSYRLTPITVSTSRHGTRRARAWMAPTWRAVAP